MVGTHPRPKGGSRVPTQAHRSPRRRRHDAGARRCGSRHRRERRQLELHLVGRGYDSHDHSNDDDPFELVTLRSQQRELVRHVTAVDRRRLVGAGGRPRPWHPLGHHLDGDLVEVDAGPRTATGRGHRVQRLVLLFHRVFAVEERDPESCRSRGRRASSCPWRLRGPAGGCRSRRHPGPGRWSGRRLRRD
jgi:hypothetical protein